MAFIKKQKLVEEVKEEPVVETITESVEDNLQSALLEVVADELSYVAKLNRMIELAEEAGKDDLVTALKKSRASMKTNIAEVYGKGKKILGLVEENEQEDEKEAVTEAVDPSKVYNGEKVSDIVSDYTVDLIGTDAANELEMLSRSFHANEDYTAEQIDAELNKYSIDPEAREAIETEISQLPDAKIERQQEFKMDMDNDIGLLEELKDEMRTFAGWDRLVNLIVALKGIEYDGQPGVCWGVNDYGKGKGTIIA